MPGIENLDKDKNQQIDLLEIQEALKPNGFLDSTNKNFEDNMTHLKQDLQKNSYEPQKEYLKTSLSTTLTNAKYNLQEKIKQNTPLTGEEIKILKLALFLESPRYYKVDFNDTDWKKDPGVALFVTGVNPGYGSDTLFSKSKKSPLLSNAPAENKELSNTERKFQIETILQAGQHYLQFLQDKGVFQAKYEGDTQQQTLYYTELADKYSNGEQLSDEQMLFYIHQIFRDISVSGAGYSSKAGDAYKKIESILTDKTGWTQKNVQSKVVEVLYQIRQIDDAKGIYYKSGDMLLNTLTKELSACRIKRGPDSWKLNTALMQFNFLTPDKKGNFADPDVENMYLGLKNPSERGDKDILIAFKKYKLPFEGASTEQMQDLQDTLAKQINPLKQKESLQKADIKKQIIDAKQKEIIQQHKQKELLITQLQKKKIDLTTPAAQQAVAYFDQQINLNTRLIRGEPIELGTPDGQTKSINLDMIVAEQYQNMETQLLAEIVQKGVVYEILQQNTKTTNFIKSCKQRSITLTTDEKTIDMLADITGAGDYRSDKTFNTAVEVTKELVIQVALMAISGGIANIAAKGTLLAIQGGAKLLKAGSYVVKVGEYAKMSKTAFWASIKFAPELFAADIIAEGTIFHLVNTTLNAPLQGLSTQEYFQRINPFGSHQEQQADGSVKTISSALGYAESVAFMGVMKSFGSVTNQITKAMGGKTLTSAQQSKEIIKQLTANAITLPGEVAGMQLTSTAINFMFGREVDLTPQSRAHTLALVIGLRIAHGGTKPIKKVTENIEGKIEKNSLNILEIGNLEIQKVNYDKKGNVKSVEYRALDAQGKEIAKGIASQATIDAAMKEKVKSEKIEENGIEKIPYKVYETKFLEIQKDTPYSIETVELNGCTGAVIMIKNDQGKSFSLATHFPPIENFRAKSIADIQNYLTANKAVLGNITNVEIFAVTDVSRKNTDYQTIVDMVKTNTQREPILHLSEYTSRDKNRAESEQLGKMNIDINKEGKIIFIHEGKEVDITPKDNLETSRAEREKNDPESSRTLLKNKIASGKKIPGEAKDTPKGNFAAPNEKFAETDEAFARIVTNRKEDIRLINKLEINDFIDKSFRLILEEMGLNDPTLKIEITEDNNQYDLKNNTLYISRNWAGHEKKNVVGQGNKAEIFGAICHELNHYLQWKEVILNYEDDELLTRLQNTGNGQEYMGYILEKYPDNIGLKEYFDKANIYENNWRKNYISPDILDNGQVKNYAEYKNQPVEAESFRRGDRVVREYNNVVKDAVMKGKKGNENTKPDPESKKNADLPNLPRLQTAEKLLKLPAGSLVDEKGKFTPKGQAILDAHNQPGIIDQLTFGQIRARIGKLEKRFTPAEIRILMDNYICGKNTREIILKAVNPIKKLLMSGNVDWALTKIEKFAPFEALVITEMPTNLIDAIYSGVDKFCNTKFGFEISDVTMFLGKLKMLRDASAGAMILYTETLQEKNTHQEVLDNAKLSWEPRVQKGWEITEKIGKIQLNETQKEIMKEVILKTHAYGHTEPGKNGEAASIYNYTIHQLGVKFYMLMEGMQRCGLDYKQSKAVAKELLRKGICGEALSPKGEAVYCDNVSSSYPLGFNINKIDTGYKSGIFKIVKVSENEAQLYINENVDAQRRVFGSLSTILGPVAEHYDSPKEVEKVVTLKPGRLRKTNGVWELVDKIEVKLIDTKSEVENIEKFDPETVKTNANTMTIDPDIVEANSKLSAADRIIEAKRLLGLETLTFSQQRAVQDAHFLPKANAEKLLEANFNKEQIKLLMDNGVCGEVTITKTETEYLIEQNGIRESSQNKEVANTKMETKYPTQENPIARVEDLSPKGEAVYCDNVSSSYPLGFNINKIDTDYKSGIFKIVKVSENEAELYINENKDAQKRVFGSLSTILGPVTEHYDSPKEVEKVVTVKPGKLRKTNGVWEIVDKIEVKLIDTGLGGS